MNGQDNPYLKKWGLPEQPPVAPPPQKEEEENPYLKKWGLPEASTELIAEKPDIKTRYRMARTEASASPLTKRPFWEQVAIQFKGKSLAEYLAPGKTPLEGMVTADYSKLGDIDFWKNTLKNMGIQSRELVKAIPTIAENITRLSPQGWAQSIAEIIVPPPKYKSVVQPKGYKEKRAMPKIGELPPIESLKTAGELITFLPRAGYVFMQDPVDFIEKRPLDFMFLVEALGVKPAMNLRKSLKAGKAIRGVDVQGVINKIPDEIISKEIKTKVKNGIKSDTEIRNPKVFAPELEISDAQLQEMIQKGRAKEQAPSPETKSLPVEGLTPEGGIREFHSGYNFKKEFKDSINRLKSGEASVVGNSIVTKTLETPIVEKPPKVKIVKPSTKQLELEAYTYETPAEPVIVGYKHKGTMPLFEHEIEPFLSKKATDLKLGPVKNLIENPIRIFEEYPTLKKTLYDQAKNAEATIARKIHEETRSIKDTRKSLPPESNDRLGIYATAQQKGGKALLKEQGYEVPELTPQEMAVYEAGRKKFDTFYDQINEARKLAGKQPLKKVENYFTWMRNVGVLKDMGIHIINDSAPSVDIHLNATPFKYALARKIPKGRALQVPISLKYFDVYENYARLALKHIYKTPVIAKGRGLLESFKFESGKTKAGDIKFKKWNLAQDYPGLSSYVREWLDTFSEQKSAPIFGSEWLEKQAGKLNKNIGMAILSYNVRSASIQPTAIRGAWVEIGTKFLAEGISKNLSQKWREFAWKHSNVIAPRNMDVHIQSIFEDRVGSKLGKVKAKVAQLGIEPLKFLDLETARSTWLGAYDKGIKGMKLNHKQAVTYADDIVTRTQASGMPSDVSKIQRTATGKLATLFQTFVINEWNYISKDVLGIRNPKATVKSRVSKATRLVFATAMINALFEGVLKLRSPYPAPEWAILHAVEEGEDNPVKFAGEALTELAEQLPVFGGAIRWSSPYKPAQTAAGQVASGTLSAVGKILRLEPKQLTKEDLETLSKIIGVPGMSQAMKYYRRRKQGASHVEALMGIRTDITEPSGKRGR